MLKFLLTFVIDIITPVISSTHQIVCEVMFVQHVIEIWLEVEVSQHKSATHVVI